MSEARRPVELPLPAPGRPGEPCHRCAEPLLADQRYCLACGARRGAGGPLDFAAMLRPAATVPAAAAAGWRAQLAVPVPTAVTMLAALLVTGILLGGLSDSRSTPAAERLAIALPPPALSAAAASGPTAQAPETIAPLPLPDPVSDPAPEPSTTVQPEDTSVEEAEDTPEPSASDGDDDEATDPADDVQPQDTLPATAGLPPIKHVFMIVLGGQIRPSAFTAGAGAPYLSETLVPEGTLVRDLHAIAESGLANAMALISGQAPTGQTLAGCPTYSEVTPASSPPGEPAAPEALDGCVHPAQTPTLMTELERASLRWRAYVESQEDGGAGVAATCRRPALGAADPWREPREGDAYATARNPFVYFHAIIDSPACATNVVGLDVLRADLALPPGDVPAFSYIVPDLCREAGAAPCAPDAPPGLASADAFLADLVPRIRASKAYADSLIVVTFDRPPAAAPAPAPPAAEPAAAPGKVGALLLSPFVRAGRLIGGRRDTYSLLATVARVLGVDPPANAANPAARPFGRGLFDDSTKKAEQP